ncbi:MAG: acyl-CoA dehydrogenase family protein [Acidimicrobiales bacterium]
MNLTEPDAGSDVGALTTRATPTPDGTWRIRGQKIFITWGDHDMADNIVHLVLARTPDSPPGTKGISLFLVPKFLVDDDGTIGARNDVHCASLEHKMGLHASPTCVMTYGDGDSDRMAHRRGARRHARDVRHDEQRPPVGRPGRGRHRGAGHATGPRLRPRTPPGPSPGCRTRRGVTDRRASRRAADAARHAGLRDRRPRPVLPQRGGDRPGPARRRRGRSPRSRPARRAADTAVEGLGHRHRLRDGQPRHTDPRRNGVHRGDRRGAASRDIRVAPIYEGTNGIQAIDLVGRKLPMDGGAVVQRHLDAIAETAAWCGAVADLADVVVHLDAALAAVRAATTWMLDADAVDRLPGATAFLEMLAVLTGAEILAAGALAARSLDSDAATDRAVLARYLPRRPAWPGCRGCSLR